jgi:hypothetical protein
MGHLLVSDDLINKDVKKYIILILLAFSTTVCLFAQDRLTARVTDQITSGLLKIDNTKLKDSIAFYSWSYELKVKKLHDSTVVETISVNDSIAKLLISDYSFLSAINYKTVLGKR